MALEVSPLAGPSTPKAVFASDSLRNGLLTVAHVLLDSGLPGGTVRDGLAGEPMAALGVAGAHRASTPAPAADAPVGALEFANGLGGFSDAGRTYRIELDHERCTPMPWINVIANPVFGRLVSAEGGGYTWSLNSQQNPITPWPNDPVSDSPHDVLYLRDEDSGVVWSANALDSCCRRDLPGQARQRLPSLHERRPRPRARVDRVRANGRHGETAAPALVQLFGVDAAPVADRVAFIDMGGLQLSMSGDRDEFLGVPGAVDRPAALQTNAALSGRVGPGLDPCGALRPRIEMPPDTQIELDGLALPACEDVALADDGRVHTLHITMGGLEPAPMTKKSARARLLRL